MKPNTNFLSLLRAYTSLMLLFWSLGASSQQAAASTTSLAFELQMDLDSIYAAHPGSVGIMVHVESPDQQLSWSGAAGQGDKEDDMPLDPKRPALIASNTKTYTAVAILCLIEQGYFNLESPIGDLLTAQTTELFSGDGYDFERITVSHLLSHTSGIFDYVNADAFFGTVEREPMHRWTAQEQLELALSAGEPLGAPGSQFSYADSNFLLLAEIIAEQTEQDFYSAIRELLAYKANGLDNTWFETLETRPISAQKRVYQYSGGLAIDSYSVDPSFDLYGAGGIAATSKDLAQFSQLLFEGKFFEDPKTLDLIYTKMPYGEGEDPRYLMGLMSSQIEGLQAYGHGGFWGTVVQYLPELNSSIAVFVLERDKRVIRKDVLSAIVRAMKH